MIEREEEFDGAGTDGKIGSGVSVVDVIIEGGLGGDVIEEGVPVVFGVEDLLEWVISIQFRRRR